jgi:hypothetical protein
MDLLQLHAIELDTDIVIIALIQLAPKHWHNCKAQCNVYNSET